ncbi:hypothetical protein ACFQ1M_05540 [Sungkyunkwania multivorans]|uniref:Uncharacterized protein n=1 Tax=Sungkyunkwania multivorans TaxID=1173618 RepID=A0ABW3CV75_9FLAO
MVNLKKALLIFITFFAHSITKAYVKPFFAQTETPVTDTFFAPTENCSELVDKATPKVYVVIKLAQQNTKHLQKYAADLNAKLNEYGIKTETLFLERNFEGAIYREAEGLGAAYILYVNQIAPTTKDVSFDTSFDVLSFDLEHTYSWKEVVYQLNLNLQKENSIAVANNLILKRFIENIGK